MENYSTPLWANIWLQFSKLKFPTIPHLPNMASLRIKLLFSQSPAIWSWKTWYKFQRNHNGLCGQPSCLLLGGLLRKSTGTLKPSPKTQSENQEICYSFTAVLSLASRSFHTDIPKAISTGSPLDSEPGFVTSNLCFSFLFSLKFSH